MKCPCCGEDIPKEFLEKYYNDRVFQDSITPDW